MVINTRPRPNPRDAEASASQGADYRVRHANAAASTGQGESGSDPIGLLTELLEGLADRGAEISRYADEVKIAGLACEKIYEH